MGRFCSSLVRSNLLRKHPFDTFYDICYRHHPGHIDNHPGMGNAPHVSERFFRNALLAQQANTFDR